MKYFLALSIVIFLCSLINCTEKSENKSNTLLQVKHNLYKDLNNTYYFRYAIPEKDKVLYTYDSTLVFRNEEVNIRDVVDNSSYECIGNGYFKDLKNVYVERNTNIKPKFCVIDINPKQCELLGFYIKDSNKVFYNSKELQNVKVSEFKTKTFFKEGLGTEVGFDKKQIYFMGKALKANEIEDLFIMKNEKDSLLQLLK